MEKKTGALSELSLEAPLINRDGLFYLEFTSENTNLVRFHRSLNAISKKRPDFLRGNYFGYR